MARPEELTTPLYSLGAKLLVVCAGPRQPCLQSGNNFCAVDTYLYFCDSAGDKPWYLHRGKLPLRCISNLALGVTNEGREAISGATSWCPPLAYIYPLDQKPSKATLLAISAYVSPPRRFQDRASRRTCVLC